MTPLLGGLSSFFGMLPPIGTRTFTTTPATGGDVRLLANRREIGKGRMDNSVPVRFSGYSGMDIGRDNGGVVGRGYADKASFAFTGTVKKVVFDLKPHMSGEDEQALHEHAHHSLTAHGIAG